MVVVRATSGTGERLKTADQTITVTVTDVDGEAPGVPAAPTVASASVSSLTAAWAAPANAGPPITDYDYRYRVKSTQGSWTEVTNTTSTALRATITELAEDTEYEVQVRATNDEGTSGWSDPGSASTDANAAPAFTSSATFDAAENQTAAGTVEASDSDAGDSVTGYAIQGGADRSKFSIGAASGVLTFRSAPNFEAATDADTDNDYVVVVRATSGTGERLKTADQTITVTVTDEAGEAPGVPATPTVSSASVSSLTVTWAAPANAGPPITDYDYRYRVKTPQGSWTEVTNTTSTALRATITELAEDTEYEVQVRATNDEGTSGWSDPGSASTDANAAPAFTSPATFDAAENQTAAGTVEASDSDAGDSVTGYAIQGGADRSKFSIGAASGVLTFTSAPNFEAATDDDASNTYVVVVRATSGTGERLKTADQTITVTVTDEAGEAPGAPATPTVASASVSSVTVTWAAPANAGPPITDYDYRYRVKTPQGSWTEVTNTTITALGATITGLAEDTEYEVQVRATNDEGTSGWSDPGSASTDANAAPAFTSSATFDAAENQTAAGTVEASDSDAGDSVTGYAIQGGADRSKFSIGAASGVLTFTSAPNFEAATDADTDNDYVVVVRATSGTGERLKTADQTITVTVTDVAGEAPGVPAAPTVASASVSSLTVTWAAPANAGPPITDYDYRYRVKTPQGSWTEVTNTTSTALRATITELAEDTEYEVQVRATNDEGTSGWSDPGSASTDANAAPAFTSSATFDAAENQTAAGTVEASDSDAGDSVTGYAIQGGADRSKFSIGAASGVLTFRSAPNFEAATDRRRQQHVRGGGAGDQRHGRAAEDGGPDDHGDGDGRGRRSAGRPGRADGGVGVGEQCDGGLGRARERRAADHGLRLPVPGEDAAGVVDGGDEHDEHGAPRDDHGARGGHGVRGAGAGDQRRGHERLVRPGQRLDGRERGAGVHLVGDVRRGGEPDRGGDGRGVGQRRRRQRDGLRDPGRRGQIKVLDRGRERGADVHVGAELRGRDGCDTDNDYVVVVRATSGTGERLKTADQTITVTVTDEAGEAPGAPATPTVSSASVSSVTVTWAAPANAGPPITDYDYRYRVKTPQGSWTEVTNTTSTALGATITGLAEDTEYEVQVRATNAEGTSDWSDPPGSASTDANAAPSFTTPATFDAAENQTAAGTVEASDSDAGDSVTGYAIQGGADRSKFSIGAASGVLTFTSAPNFEAATDADTDNDYVVVVRATSGTGERLKTADQTITVTVTDEAGEAPGAPATPTVSSASVSSVTVTWAAPANAGPPITDYDYRYRVKSPQGSWTEVTNTTSTALGATIAGLAEDTEYEVQVRATNAEGTSGWSDPGSASTATTPGVTVSKTALTVTEDDTAGDSYTVVLDSRPTADVTVTVAGHSGTAVTPDPTTLTFTSTTWGTAQTVTVTAGDDADTANESVSLTHSAASTDTDYGGITIAGVAVTVTDNDAADPAVCAVPSLSGRNVIWTGAMTVAADPTFAGVFGFESERFGSLDDQTFTVGANDYTTQQVSLMGNVLTFATTNSALTAGEQAVLRLHVCAADLDFSAAPVPTGHHAYLFSTTGLSWSSGDAITLRLSLPAGPPPPPPPVTDLAQVLGVGVVPGNAQLVVTWTAVSTATGYTVQWMSSGQGYNIGDRQATVTTGSTTRYTIPSLTNGTEYTVRVIATRTGATDGPPSAEVTGTPFTTPGAPQHLSGVPGDEQVMLTWDAPSSDGGSAILRYEYAIDDSGTWIDAGLDLEETVPGLTNGQQYAFEVRAVNSAGPGAPARTAATPLGMPSVPESLTATGGDGEVVLEWTEPADDGGSPVTGYEYRYAAGQAVPEDVTWRDAGTELTATVSGLENETRYTFEVRARNRVGPGETSGTTALPLRLRAELFSSAAAEGEALVVGVRRSGRLAFPAHAYIGVTDSALPGVTATEEGRDDGLGRHRLEFAAGAAEATVTVTVAFDGERRQDRVLTATLDSAELEVDGVRRPYELVTPTLVVPVTEGDAGLSVADARVQGKSSVLAFTVSLDRTRDVAVRVDYATEDGSARAGEDYTPVSGTLTIEAGGRERTVEVPVLPALHVTGERTLTLRLSNAVSAVIDDGVATGTIVRESELPKAWLARFGRTASDHAAQAIARRLEAGQRETQVTVAGRRVDGLSVDGLLLGVLPSGGWRPASAVEDMATRLAAPALAASGAPFGGVDADPGTPGLRAGTWGGAPGALDREPFADAGQTLRRAVLPDFGYRLPGAEEALMGTSFYVERGAQQDVGGGTWAAWGDVAATRFEGDAGGLALNGDVVTGTAGLDRKWRAVLVGLALSRSSGEGGYGTGAGTIASTLTSVHPYVQVRLGERAQVWGAAGWGRGGLEITPESGAALEADLRNSMAAAGARAVLMGAGGLEIALRSDFLWTETSSDGTAALAEAVGTASRGRLMLEGAGQIQGLGGVVRPKVEGGVRYDGGDAETGQGFEVGGGLDWARGSLTLQVNGRMLVAHADESYEEWGYSGSLVYEPGADGLGLQMRVGSSAGAAASGIQNLWALENASGLVRGGAVPFAQRFDAEVGYGLGRGTLWYPYFVADDSGQTRYGLKLSSGRTIGVGLEFGRRKSVDLGPQDAMLLRGELRF